MRTPNNEPVSSDILDPVKGRPGGPERRCILSGEVLPRDEMLRLAISPAVATASPAIPPSSAWLTTTMSSMAA